MAVNQVLRCDRCNAVGEAREYPADWRKVTFTSFKGGSPTSYGEIDLCVECKFSLREWWGQDIPKGLKL